MRIHLFVCVDGVGKVGRSRALFALVLACALGATGLHAQSRVSVQVDWHSAQRDQRRDQAALHSENRKFRAGGATQANLALTKLPVLVINTGPVRAAPEFRQQGTSYVAAYRFPRANLSILGSAMALSAPPEVQAKLTTGASGEYAFSPVNDEQEQDDVANLTFSRYGASYILRLACERPDDDRCRKPDFLKSIAVGLANVGGRP